MNGCRVSVSQDDENYGDGCWRLAIAGQQCELFNTTELYTYKWLR